MSKNKNKRPDAEAGGQPPVAEEITVNTEEKTGSLQSESSGSMDEKPSGVSDSTGVTGLTGTNAGELSDENAYSRELFEKDRPGASVIFAPDTEMPDETHIPVDADLAFYTLTDAPKKEKEEPEEKKVREKVKIIPGAGVRSAAMTVAYIALLLVLGILLGVFLVEAFNDVMAFSKDDGVIRVEITNEDMSVGELADMLHEEGLIKYPFLFKLYVGIKRDGVVKLKVGSYDLRPSYNYDKMIGALNPTPPLTIVKITFPEGITTDEVIDLFVENGIGTREGFYEAIAEADFDYWFLDYLETGEDRYYRLDGYLYPDTYQFYSTSSEKSALKKMLDNFNKKFGEQYSERIEQLGLTTDQALIIASMIQAEASRTSDYIYVSAVFHNRLNDPEFTKFESDATIQYVLSHEYGGRHEELTAEDLLIDSPYNTRLKEGFPPGPICNVSINALKAAIYPDDECGYYYFVTGNDGYMMYAATYAEHLQNIKDIEAEKAD